MCYAKKVELMPRLSDYKFITISSLRQAVIKVVWICNPDNVNIRIYNPYSYGCFVHALQMMILHIYHKVIFFSQYIKIVSKFILL